MKRILIIVVCLFIVNVSFAQSDKAKKMYMEATGGNMSPVEYLKGDFTQVDSTSMHDLAVLFYQANDFVSAGSCWEIALGKVKKHGKAYEKIINCLSLVYSESSDISKIEWLMQIIEEHNQQELLKVCNDYKCKIERAQYYMAIGEEIQAKACIKESYELCSSEQQRVEVDEAHAKILFDIHDFEGAAQYYHSAANRWLAIGNMESYANAMYWSAQNYLISGRFDVGEQNAKNAVEVLNGNVTVEGQKKYALYLACMADAMFCQQKYQQALQIYEQELAIYSKLMPNTEKHADAFEDVGKAQVRLKQYEQAELNLQQACNLYKELNLQSKYSNTYSELLICKRKSGNNQQADAMEQEADNKRKVVWTQLLEDELKNLAITEKYLGSKIYTSSLNTIAGSYYGLDNYKEAAHYYALYTQSLRSMLQEKFLLSGEADRKMIWNEQQQNIDDYRYRVAALPDSAVGYMSLYIPALYDMELMSKGIMLNSVIEFENVLANHPNKKLLSLYKTIQENQKQIEELQSVASDENLQKVIELKQINSTCQDELMHSCASYSDYTRYLSYTWKDVQKELGKNDIAIEFTTVSLSPLDKDNYILALILAPTGEPVMEVISTRAILNILAQKEDLYDNSQYYGMFWGFMQKHLVGKEKVYFAPDNSLSNIAIEYFYDGEKTFFEKYEAYRLSSTKELCRKYSEKADEKSIAIFGDIKYNTNLKSQKRDALSFGELEHSKEEIDGIAAALKSSYKIDSYRENSATEEKFRKLSGRNPQILHISSHGSYIGDENTGEADAMEYSLLALSGANQWNGDVLNDGLITAADVAQMSLRQCDMAVLSACNTGIGGKGVDGIFGLQRGFKNAGVRTLLMSLKSVYDESTAKIMVAFYKGMAEGKTKRQSLLDAQRCIKSMGYTKGEHWAPFILLDGLD